MSRKFERRKEDFICENCGHRIVGNGYTNHCPACLFSKHVDVNPGDRKCQCLGLMEPIGTISSRKGYTIIHRCQKCGAVKKNKSAKNDSFEAILAVSQKGGSHV